MQKSWALDVTSERKVYSGTEMSRELDEHLTEREMLDRMICGKCETSGDKKKLLLVSYYREALSKNAHSRSQSS